MFQFVVRMAAPHITPPPPPTTKAAPPSPLPSISPLYLRVHEECFGNEAVFIIHVMRADAPGAAPIASCAYTREEARPLWKRLGRFVRGKDSGAVEKRTKKMP